MMGFMKKNPDRLDTREWHGRMAEMPFGGPEMWVVECHANGWQGNTGSATCQTP